MTFVLEFKTLYHKSESDFLCDSLPRISKGQQKIVTFLKLQGNAVPHSLYIYSKFQS